MEASIGSALPTSRKTPTKDATANAAPHTKDATANAALHTKEAKVVDNLLNESRKKIVKAKKDQELKKHLASIKQIPPPKPDSERNRESKRDRQGSRKSSKPVSRRKFRHGSES